MFTTTDPGDTRPNYNFYTFTVTGTGADAILFNARDDPSYNALDNVSFSAATSTTPEPSSAGLVLIGFGLLAGVAWRRRHTAS